MKSDRKMAQDILNRVNEENKIRLDRKKTALKITGTAMALTLVAAAAFSFMNTEKTVTPTTSANNTVSSSVQENKAPVASQLNKQYSFLIANASETEEAYEIFEYTTESNLTLPFAGILQVTDIRGLSPHSVSIMSHNLIERLEEKYGENKTFSVFGSETQPTAIHFGTLGQMAVKTEDASALESIVISCTDNGEITVHDIYAAAMGDSEGFLKSHKEGQEITVSGEEYLKHYDSREEGMLFDWFISQETEDMLRSNPDAPLSEINDKITVTINYKDGTSEQFTLTLSFDDDGILTVIYN